jgi:RNase P subunit RPR2
MPIMPVMRSIRQHHCLGCGRELEGAELSRPIPGDAVICKECNHIMIFNYQSKLREPTTRERADVAKLIQSQ